jgi:hypothetical protein
VDLLIIPSGTSGTLLDAAAMAGFTLGGPGAYSYVDAFTPTHTFLTNAVYSRRTPFSLGGVLYSNSTHAIYFNMAHVNATRDEGFVWEPTGLPTFSGVSATMTFKIVFTTGNHNFDLLHLQSTNYGIAQMQVSSGGLVTIVAHSEPQTAGSITGIEIGTRYNLHTRMNAVKQRLEILLVKADTGEVIGAASKPITSLTQGYGIFQYIKIQDYLWNRTDPVGLEMGLIALDWTYKTFPLEPIVVPTPSSVYAVQTDTNTVRVTWFGRGVTALIEKDSGSGFTSLTNEYSSPVGFGPNGRTFTDTNVVEGVTYQYRITSQIGDYSSSSVVSSAVTITNSYPGFVAVWQQETNNFQASGTINSAVDFPAVEQRIKGVNQSTVQVSKVSFNFDNFTENTATNGEMLQVSFFTETNRGGVHLGTSRGTVMGTNVVGWRDFVFFTPARIPPGTNFWMALEGNWILCQMRLSLDGYLPDQGFDYLYHGSSLQGGLTNDLLFRLFANHVPVPPTNVLATQTADGEITVSWTDTNDGLTRYELDHFTNDVWVTDVTNVFGTNWVATGLLNGSTNKWRVSAYVEGEPTSETAKVESNLYKVTNAIVYATVSSQNAGGSVFGVAYWSLDASLDNIATFITATESATIGAIDAYLKKANTPTFPFRLELWTLSGGQPGTFIAGTANLSPSSLTGSYAFFGGNLTSPTSVVNGTEYVVVFHRVTGTSDGANYILVDDALVSDPGHDTMWKSPDLSTWTANDTANITALRVRLKKQ